MMTTFWTWKLSTDLKIQSRDRDSKEEYMTSGQAWEKKKILETFFVTTMLTISTINFYLRMIYGLWPLNWFTIYYQDV